MRALLGISLLACAAAAVGAQAPASNQIVQQPTFRGGINYVRVDMYASTREGGSITDLRREEIELLEDGKPQEIKDFEHVQVDNLTPQELRVEPNSVEQSRQMAGDGRARVFVIFLDTYHTTIEGSANMRIPLIRFLDRALGANDMVAVMTPEMSASDISLGRKTTVISNIMQREWTWGRRNRIATIDPKEMLYEQCYPNDKAVATAMKERRREKLTLDALQDLIIHLQGIRDERKAILTVSEGWRLFQPDRNLADRGGSDVPNRLGRVFDPQGRRAADVSATGVDKSECDADRIVLANIDDAQRMRELTESANRGNVTFYPVYPRGLAVFDSDIGPDRPPSLQQDGANLRSRQDSLRGLAVDTDGTSIINTNDIEGGISRIVADLSSYYLLGYESTNSKLDGKFRSITVRVKRPDVKVRARRGYRGLTADEVMTRTDRGTPGAATANLTPAVVVNPRAPFRLRSTAWTSDAGGSLSASLWLVGELDYATRKDLAWSNGASADISVVAGNGDRVASLQVPFATSDGGFTVKVPTEKTLAPGDYAVRVRITPQAGDALPLSDLTRVVVPASAMPLGESVMLRRGPSTGPRYIATADPRFQRSDRLRLELPTQLEGAPAARLLDRTGKPLQVPVMASDRRDDTGGFRWIVVDTTLAPLAPGEYVVEAAVGDVKQLTPFRVVP
jgi:VWFA-related protein